MYLRQANYVDMCLLFLAGGFTFKQNQNQESEDNYTNILSHFFFLHTLFPLAASFPQRQQLYINHSPACGALSLEAQPTEDSQDGKCGEVIHPRDISSSSSWTDICSQE